MKVLAFDARGSSASWRHDHRAGVRNRILLAEGRLALTDTAARRGLAIVFGRAVLPYAWLWQVYGGWRGHQHLALEAWTSLPMDLEGAQAAGRARSLDPGETLETEVAFVLHEGLDRVTGVRREGDTLTVE